MGKPTVMNSLEIKLHPVTMNLAYMVNLIIQCLYLAQILGESLQAHWSYSLSSNASSTQQAPVLGNAC